MGLKMAFFKIALRSVLKHKNKMIAIGILVIFGTMLIIVGQSAVISIKYLSKNAIIKNFTGNFIIYSNKSKEKPSPFSFSAPLKPIEDFKEIYDTLKKYPEVDAIVPLAQNMGIISEQGKEDIQFVFTAIDPENYKKVFKNFEIVKGSFFDENGILISEKMINRAKKDFKLELKVGQEVTVLGFTSGGSVNAVKTKIVGIFKPKYFSNISSMINFMDINTYRNLYNFEGIDESTLPENLKKSYDTENEEDIFALADEDILSNEDLKSLKIKSSSGYTMISVVLKENVNTEQFLNTISPLKDQFGIKFAKWDEASGGLAQMSKTLQIFINVVSILIFITVAIIIMNTLIVNILERTGEIGTIRAIGGKKSFIRKMFITESLILSFLAAIAGTILSIIVIAILHKTGIQIKGMVSEILFGGGKLYLSLNIGSIIQSLIIVLVVSIIATLYPLRIATKVTPLKAMSSK